MEQATPTRAMIHDAKALLLSALFAATGWLIFIFAPREASMGDVQRIVYLHVAVAWCGLAGCIAMGCCGAMYLLGRSSVWDYWSQAAGEVGWLCTTLTLATGSLWAHEAWNTWWTWEPRLTASLILWTMFAAYFLVRSSIETSERQARVGAVLAILALADIPLVIMATRWFRGIHPVTPEMEPRMRLVLWLSITCFSVFFVSLVVLRRQQLRLSAQLASLEQQIGT